MNADCTISLNAQNLPAGADGDVPEWIHLLPTSKGAIQTGDKRGPYHVTNAAALIKASFAVSKRLPIDENHATDLAAPKGLPAPARGWIVEMQARSDGLWGRVEWTDEGRRLVESRAYRAISPVILHNKANHVAGILRASLVNRPNLQGLATLHQQEDGVMPLNERLAELLGLNANTGEDALFDAVASLHAAQTSDASTALQSQLDDIGSALGVEQGGDILAAARAAAPSADGVSAAQFTALQSELNTVTTQLNALREENTRSAAEAFVDGAIREGRVGVSAQRDRYIAMHMSDRENTEALISGVPKLGPTNTSQLPPDVKDGTVSLNAEELAGKAKVFQQQKAEQGVSISITEAVHAVKEGKA